MQLDYKLFEAINQYAGQSQLLDTSVMLFSKFGPIFFGLVFLWLWFSKSLNNFENRKIVLFALTVVAITIGINLLIELFYFRPRPFVVHDVNFLSDKSSSDPSFPSNHAAGSFALAFALFWKRRKLGSILIASAVLMAFSRIYVGVHYPLDVIAGMLIAASVTMIVIWQQHLLEKPFTWIIHTFSKKTIEKI